MKRTETFVDDSTFLAQFLHRQQIDPDMVPIVSQFHHNMIMGAVRAVNVAINDLKDLGVVHTQGISSGCCEGDDLLHFDSIFVAWRTKRIPKEGKKDDKKDDQKSAGQKSAGKTKTIA